jgi:hypothetical protein
MKLGRGADPESMLSDILAESIDDRLFGGHGMDPSPSSAIDAGKSACGSGAEPLEAALAPCFSVTCGWLA